MPSLTLQGSKMAGETNAQPTTMLTTGEKPPRCAVLCKLANMPGLAECGIFLTRNCVGPGLASGDVGDKIRLHTDGTAETIRPRQLVVETFDGRERTVQFIDSVDGELTCRNRGANVCIDMALQRTPKASAPLKVSLHQQIAREMFGENKEAYQMEASDVYLALVKYLHGITDESDDDEQRFAYSAAYRAQLQDARAGNSGFMQLMHSAIR